MSSRIIAKVVAVRGTCSADLKIGDKFLLEELRITALAHNKSCSFAYASLVANMGRIKLQHAPVSISCPDPATGLGGNVIFELSPEEDDENHQH